MDLVRNISAMSWFAAKKFVVLIPFITLAVVGFCAIQLAWMAWLVGLPPAEFGFGFIQEAALPVLGGVALPTIIALCFAVIAGFGGWCLSQSTAPFGVSHAMSWGHHFLRSLTASIWRLYSYTHSVVCLTRTGGLFSFSSPRRRTAAPVAAALSGATPLLE